MAESVGIAAATAQFAELLFKAAKLAREIYAATDATSMAGHIAQLESCAAVGHKIAESSLQDDPITAGILQRYIPKVKTLNEKLSQLRINETDGLFRKLKKAVESLLKEKETKDFFADLRRDERVLLLHRVFASKTKGRHVEGTCIWITQTPQYRSWFSSNAPSPGLILEGGPGKGKSMMAIFLTRQLEDLAKQSDNESTIYFFCDNSNARQNNALSVFRCLIWQLCRLKPELLSHGTKELSYRGNNIQHLLDPPATGVETLWRIFRSMIMDEKAGTISCVIDGLDECDGDSVFQILDKLHELAAEAETDPTRRNFRFIILSRPHTAGQKLPQLGVNLPKVRLDPDSDKEVHSDIKTFIDKQIDDLANASTDNQWPAPFREQVAEILHEKAGGTFLWVGFVTQDLRSKTPMEVKKCLKTLPVGLDGIYDRILRKVPPQHRQGVRSILQWVCFAHHPLRTTELAGLIDERSWDTSFQSGMESDSFSESDSDDCIVLGEASCLGSVARLQDLLRFCNHFVSLVKGHRYFHGEFETVHFIHQSAKDYLMRRVDGRNSDLDYFRMDKRHVIHEHLGRQCMNILTQEMFSIRHQCVLSATSSAIPTGNSIVPIPYRFAAADYAACFWVHHLHQSGDAYRPDTHTQILQLISQDEPSRSVWTWRCDNKIGMISSPSAFCHPQIVRDDNTPLLTVATALGLNSTVKKLIDGMAVEDYISIARLSSTMPLSVAIGFGFHKILRTIVDCFGLPAVSLEPGILTKTVLWSGEASPEVVKYLLKVSNDPKGLFRHQLEYSLISAVIRDNEVNFILLSNALADPTLANRMVPLVRASIDHRFRNGKSFQRPDLLERLISLGLVDLINRYKVPVFQAAAATLPDQASSEHEVASRVTQVLLDAGAEVDVVNLQRNAGQDDNPGQCDSTSTAHAFINFNDKPGLTDIHLAVQSVDYARLEALLRSGLEVNAPDSSGRTPLLLLMDEILYLFFQDAAIGEVWNPATLDFIVISCDCLEILWKGGANGNVQDSRGRTALHVLAEIMEAMGSPTRLILYLAMATEQTSIDQVQAVQKSYNPKDTWHLREGLLLRERLLKFNINLDLKDKEGRTARDIYPLDVFWDLPALDWWFQ